MPTFSAIAVEKIASTKEKSPKQENRSSLKDSGDRPAGNRARPRFASPILYTTPKTTRLPYIARSFTSSPYVINHKRRVPPSPVVVERLEAQGVVSQNGFLLVDRNQECGDTQKGKIEKLGGNGEDLVRNDKTLARNGEILIKNEGKMAIEEVERAVEEVRVREQCGAAGKLVKSAENLVDGENLVHGDEYRTIDNVGVTEESWVAEKNVKSEKNIVNQELSLEIGRFEVGGGTDVLKSVERDQADEVSILAEDEGLLEPYTCSTEFSPKNMEVYSPANGKENVAVALNVKRFPISGWSKDKTTYGRNEGGDVAGSECCLKNNGDLVFQRSPGDGDYTPRTNRSDFFDAEDDLFSEDEIGQSTRSFNSRIHAELDFLRLKISKESEQRIRAEEALSVCQNICQELMEKFSAVGLSLPSIEIGACQGVEVTTVDDVINDICGQLTIARSVANAVGRASRRAEIERELKVLIDDKNSEISRLHDKIKYYELVNHEVSQRNQEAMELARRCRQRRKKKQRWIWGSFALSFAIGTTALMYTYIPWAQVKGRMPLVCSRSNIHRMASTSI